MPRSRSALAWSLAVGIAMASVGGCNGDSSDLCAPGQRMSCDDPAGCPAVQSCTPGGTFGPCECVKPLDAGQGMDVGVEAAAADGPAAG